MVVLVVLNAVAVLLVGAVLAAVMLYALAFSVDDCGDRDERRWRCTSFVPQKISLAVMAAGLLVALGLALAPLVVDDAPSAGWAWLVLPVALLVAPFVITAWIGSLPPRRRRDLR